MSMKIYISGPITGTDDFRERFRSAELELADVQIMIFQMAFLLDAEEIQSVINRKVDRQIERMGYGEING